MNILKILTITFAIGVIGCANPSINSINQTKAEQVSQGPIYVARFEGKPDFVEEATDMFVLGLEQGSSRSVIQGSSNRIEGSDIVSGGNIVQTTKALTIAKKFGASILILGKVTSHNTGGSLNGFTTVRVYNVMTGQRIGTVHQPSGMLVAYSEHQCVMKSAQKAAKIVSKSL